MSYSLCFKTCLLLVLVINIPDAAYGQLRDGQVRVRRGTFIPPSTSRPSVAIPPWYRLTPTFYDKNLTEEQKKLLFPSQEDLKTFAAFLKQENTGLFHLLPKGKYEPGGIVSADSDSETVLPILGGGAFYSFKERTNKFGPWSEILLENDHLIAAPTSKAIGMLTTLGDLPLESVTLDTPGVKFLSTFTPPTHYAEAIALSEKVSRTFEAEGFKYGSDARVLPNTTYVIRPILYKKDGYVVSPKDPYTRVNIYRIGCDGSDTLIALRIIRRDAEGGVVILWKRLQKFQSLKIKDEKKQTAPRAVASN